MAGEMVEGETDDDEENGEHTETHDLDGLSAYGVDGGNTYPVTRNGTSADQNKISDSVIVEYLIHVLFAAGVTNCGQDNRVVETESCVIVSASSDLIGDNIKGNHTIVSNIEEEP